MIATQLLKLLWPFIKEMIIGKRSLKYSARNHKWRFTFFLLVVASFGLNFMVIPKLFALSTSYLELQHQLEDQSQMGERVKTAQHLIEDLKAQIAQLRSDNDELASQLHDQQSIPTSQNAVTKRTQNQLFQNLKAIRELENHKGN